MLSLSDYIVMQATATAVDSMVTAHTIRIVGEKYRHMAPISAFSRYTAVYGLALGDGIRYDRGCIDVNATALRLRSHGNWVCDPRGFY